MKKTSLLIAISLLSVISSNNLLASEKFKITSTTNVFGTYGGLVDPSKIVGEVEIGNYFEGKICTQSTDYYYIYDPMPLGDGYYVPINCAIQVTDEEYSDNNKWFRNFLNKIPIGQWAIGVSIIAIIAFLTIFFKRLSSRCKVCGKWGAVKKVNSYQDLNNVTSTTSRKSEQITDIYGKKHTNYYHVPATRKTYDHLDKYECKYCGNKTEKSYTSSKTTED